MPAVGHRHTADMTNNDEGVERVTTTMDTESKLDIRTRLLAEVEAATLDANLVKQDYREKLQRRDDLIRAAWAAGAVSPQLEARTGLKRQQVYVIRTTEPEPHTWRGCPYRADYSSEAHHDRNCPMAEEEQQ